jgi:RNA polymerase sigma-70 factor (ECF subfamily)
MTETRTDGELLAACGTGDETAVSALLERHAPAVLRFGTRMCKDPEDARDVLQETLLAAARGLHDFRGASSLSTWLYAIARSFCIKKRRGVQPAAVESLDDEHARVIADAGQDPEEAASHHELGEALESAIRALEPPYREVLVLRDVEGLSAPEVADVLGIGVDAVKSRLHRARVAVRDRLTPLVDPPPETSECPDVLAAFSRHLEGDIAPADCARMERHVATCPRCSAACDSLKRTLVLCRSAAGEVPADVQQEVRAAVQRAISRR